MVTTTYYDVLNRAEQLSPDDQLRLMEQLAALLRRRAAAKQKRSILELQGLGKEIWEGIDPKQYIDAERDSWNG